MSINVAKISICFLEHTNMEEENLLTCMEINLGIETCQWKETPFRLTVMFFQTGDKVREVIPMPHGSYFKEIP